MTSMDAHFGRPNLLRNKDIRRRGADPLPLLLAQLLLRAGRPTVIDRTTSRPWASALFEGQRHTIWLRFSGAEAQKQKDRLLAGLDDAEWTLPGHFVADIAVDGEGVADEDVWVRLSALPIRDW